MNIDDFIREVETVANFYLATEQNLRIIPVINKIDLPHAQPDVAAHQIHDVLGIEEPALHTSAKKGKGAIEILDRIVHDIPHPSGSEDNPLQCLIFDSVFDNYKGVYHKFFYQRKSLVCDLVEPFRPIIDYKVRKIIKLGQVNEEDFDYIHGQYRIFGKKSWSRQYFDSSFGKAQSSLRGIQ